MSGEAGRFLGRGGEVALVLEAVEASAPLVLITGDAGIGKSRLVDHAASSVASRGVVVLRGRCVGLTGKLPLLPFVEAFSGMDTALAAAARERVPASLRPALDVVVNAGTRESSGAGRQHGEGGGEHSGWERERLVLAIAALLSPPARVSPTVLVLEDVHWADPFTLDLLTYLVVNSGSGATCVATMRTDERPVPETVLTAVGELQRQESTVNIELAPLPPAVVAQQVQDVLGQVPPPGMVERVVELGGGNPLFTEQLCRHAAGGKPLASGGAGSLPAGLLGFLQSRLRGLSEPARRALLVMGVAGVPLDAAQLSAAGEFTSAVTADAVRELSAAALLARPDRARLAPRHALLAAAVMEASDPISLAETHARIAGMLEARGDRSAAVAAAGHWAAAGRDTDEFRATLVAAPVAEELADFAAAATLWSRAYALAQDVPDVARDALLGVAVAALKALNWSGRNEDARELAEDALRRLSPIPEDELGGSLRYWVGLLRSMHDLAEGRGMLREAEHVLAHYPPAPDLVACLIRLGEIEASSGRPEPALELLTQAVEAAREGGFLRAETHATVALSHQLFSLGRSEEAIARVTELGLQPTIATDVGAQALLAVLESDILLQTGRLTDAQAVATTALELVNGGGHGGTWEAAVLRYNAAEAELELGRTSRALDLIESVTTGQSPDIDTTLHHQLRALADLNSGDLTSAVHRIDQVSAVSRSTAFTEDVRSTAVARALILRWAGEPQRALDSVTEDLRLLTRTDQEHRCGELLTWGAAAAADLIATARARELAEMQARAEEQLQRLKRWLEACRVNPFEQVQQGGREPADRLQWNAELSRAEGPNDPDLWNSAAQEWEEQMRTHRAAYCWWRMAQAQVDRGEPTSSISVPLQRAWELSAEMQPLRAAVEGIATRANVRLTAAPVAQDPDSITLPIALTEREIEILRHLVAGRSNSQIAVDLFISPKTVSVHVSNLLRKVGVTSRVQAAAWAERAGLTVQRSNDRGV